MYDQDNENSLAKREHIEKNLGAKRVAIYGYLPGTDELAPLGTAELADYPGTYGIVTVSANGYDKEWARDVRFDPHESAPDYIGNHMTDEDADTAATDWYITKFTRDGDNKATRIQRRRGSWDDRATGW